MLKVETVINDYISRELVQDPALVPLANDTSLLDSDSCLPARAGQEAVQASAHG